ncbi:hypothetical protein ACN47E_004261 [Coniothyrium glycines]
MSNLFRIALRDVVQGYDPLNTREFDLPLDSTRYPIGRASNNAAKRDLAPAANNAFIDSPVVSREHAVLFANSTSGTPHVYISDCKSMHGTSVNGLVLAPNRPYMLENGDELQFGVDVNRNEEFFVARKYKFEARYVPGFSLGFTVPDAESEDEDTAFVARRGSQMNPVTLDDSDAASDNSDDMEITMIQEVVTPKNDSAVPLHAYLIPEDEAHGPPRSAIVQDSYDDENEEVLVYSSDHVEDELHGVEVETNVSSTGSLEEELNYSSPEQEVADSEDDDDSITHDSFSVPRDDNGMSGYVPTDVPFPAQPEDLATIELPPLGSFHHDQGSNLIVQELAPPLPPRPSALSQDLSGHWNDDDPGAAFLPLPDLWESELSPHVAPYTGPPVYAKVQSHDAQDTKESSSTQATYYQSTVQDASYQVHRLQTPPHVPVTDVAFSPDPQPTRRTKVTIEEIVDEQPPTPTSIKDLKRKADVLDNDESPSAKEKRDPAQSAAATLVDGSVVPAPAIVLQTLTTIAQRPKKQPRSLLNRLARTATYPLLGAAGAVAAFTLLATAPDAFFAA